MMMLIIDHDDAIFSVSSIRISLHHTYQVAVRDNALQRFKLFIRLEFCILYISWNISVSCCDKRRYLDHIFICFVAVVVILICFSFVSTGNDDVDEPTTAVNVSIWTYNLIILQLFDIEIIINILFIVWYFAIALLFGVILMFVCRSENPQRYAASLCWETIGKNILADHYQYEIIINLCHLAIARADFICLRIQNGSAGCIEPAIFWFGKICYPFNCGTVCYIKWRSIFVQHQSHTFSVRIYSELFLWLT